MYYLDNQRRPSVATLFFSGDSVTNKFWRVLLAVGLDKKRSLIFYVTRFKIYLLKVNNEMYLDVTSHIILNNREGSGTK